MQRICPILDRPTEVEPTPYSRGQWKIVRCRETGFVFLADPPDYAQLAEQFAWESTWTENRRQRKEKSPVVESISALFKQIKRTISPNRNPFFPLVQAHAPQRRRLTFVDVGCGWGRLMEDIAGRTAGRREIVPIGIEVSRQMAAECATRFEKLGGRVICANALDGADELARGSIDVIILSTFLEHEYQPLKLLVKLRRAMAADGVMILKVPNFDSWNRHFRGKSWPGFRYPDHVNYFTPATLARLVQEADLSIARQNFWDRIPLSDNMYAVLGQRAIVSPLACAA